MKSHFLIHFYIIHTVHILTISIYTTLPDIIHITLYLVEISSDHENLRWVFVGTFITELKQLQIFAWNCSLFTHRTDHRHLSIFGNRKVISVHSTNRIQRWAATLLGCDFRIEYRKSKDVGKADALTRLISSHSAANEKSSSLLSKPSSTWTCWPVSFQ